MGTEDVATLTPAEARARFRDGVSSATSGWCDGATQANLIAVPAEAADDLRGFVARNPRACPLLEVTAPGATTSRLAAGADLRTDLPAYRVLRSGRPAEEVADVTAHWRDDLVTFLLGCSFTFERALRHAGVPIRHVDAGRNVAMYRTTRACAAFGRFAGPLVVSLRGIPADLVETAVAVSGGFPRSHGAPVHVGDPEGLGIDDLDRPDHGDPPVLHAGDVPVFWACGVTPQEVVAAAELPFAIAHAPGRMFITDLAEPDPGIDDSETPLAEPEPAAVAPGDHGPDGDGLDGGDGSDVR
jgi:uncharacterized protein YcsI (UPF0317 family)